MGEKGKDGLSRGERAGSIEIEIEIEIDIEIGIGVGENSIDRILNNCNLFVFANSFQNNL